MLKNLTITNFFKNEYIIDSDDPIYIKKEYKHKFENLHTNEFNKEFVKLIKHIDSFDGDNHIFKTKIIKSIKNNLRHRYDLLQEDNETSVFAHETCRWRNHAEDTFERRGCNRLFQETQRYRSGRIHQIDAR